MTAVSNGYCLRVGTTKGRERSKREGKGRVNMVEAFYMYV
jgi:hypothetical protein